MFLLLRVIIRPSNKPTEDYVIPSALWDPVALTIGGVIVLWVHVNLINYINTQQLLLNTTLFYTWRHVPAVHTAIFKTADNRTGPFMCAQYGIPHCLYIKYMWNKYICETYNYRFYRYIYFTCTLYVNSVGSHIVRT